MRVRDGLEMLYDVVPIDPGELDGFQLGAFLDTQGGMAANEDDGGEDDDEEGGGEDVGLGAVTQIDGNLTGTPPLSFQEIADAGFPWGVTAQDLADAGLFGVTQQHVEGTQQMWDTEPDTYGITGMWQGGGHPYQLSANREMQIHHVSIQDFTPANELLRFTLGMSFRDAMNVFAVGSPDIMSFMENPTYENFSELAELHDDGWSFLTGPSFSAEDGTSQQIFIFFPDSDMIRANILLENDGRTIQVSLDFQGQALTSVSLDFFHG